jgi:(R,R)-butanediol dehydrogenase / meso-butanediol dehydrogenase / diacetyl reductase
MKQVMIHGPGDLRMDEVPEPHMGPHDVLIAVGACGICGSDIGYVKQGGMPTRNVVPMPLGHELAGTVCAVGAGVQGISPGMRVVVDPMNAGNIGNGGPEGGFAPLLRVRGARAGHNIHAIPEHMPFETAALVEPLSVAMHAVNVADPAPGAKVVVWGAGCIGLGAIIALRRRGITDVVAVDLSDERLARARSLGARVVVNAGRESVAEVLGNAHGRGDLYGIPVVQSSVFIEAAGVATVLEEIVRIAPHSARVVVVSLHKKPASIDLAMLLMKELVLRGAIGYPREFPEVIAMLADPSVDVSAMVSHSFDFSEFPEAWRTACDAQRSSKVMLRFG